MQEFYPFFLVVFAAVFFSTVLGRLHVPWVIALILGGITLGPHALGILETNATVDFIAQIGLVFLMFMAGLEVKLSALQGPKKTIGKIAFFNGAVPFLAGIGIGFYLEYGFVPAFLLGIIFISSSVAVVIPSLDAAGLLGARLGRAIVAATVLEDAASLLLLSVLLQTLDPVTALPLPVFYLLLFIALMFLRRVLPKVEWFFASGKYTERDIFQQELRSVFATLVGTVIIFEILGLHPIIAGFFAGLVLSGSITSEVLKDKLRTISYGIFIPAFFVVLGSKTDLGVFAGGKSILFVTLLIVLGSMISKFAGGLIGGRLAGFSYRESSLLGAATVPQLSTTLAVVFSGVELGLLRPELASSMVILSIVTVLVSPALIKFIGFDPKRIHSRELLYDHRS